MKLGPLPELCLNRGGVVRVLARHQLRNDQVGGLWRSVYQGQESRCIPDFLVGRPWLVRHFRLAFVRPKQVEEVASVDEDDRRGRARLNLREGVGQRERHAADTSSAYRDSSRH
jgi:hypothetical protein